MTPVEPAIWTEDDRALWARIAAHDFEPAGDAFTFTARLARDHGWSLDTARRAVEEYRRFCFLALRRDGPVTPSQEVDEVWHQHLTFSRDYWQVWCGAVLKAPLHHEPTRGGAAEDRRFIIQYAATLARYEAWFGPPPACFWPGTTERFGGAPRFRMVDRATHVVLPRPRVEFSAGRRLVRAIGLGALLALLPGGSASAASLGVLDWTAGPFIAFYMAASALSLVAAHVLPPLLTPASPATPRRTPLTPVELALLAGGRQRAADVLTLEAVVAGDATLEGSRIAVDGKMLSRSDLLRDLSDTIDGIQSRLAEQSLAVSPHGQRVVTTTTFGAVLPVLALGVAKVAVGVARDKDVGLLVFLIVLTAVFAVVIAFARTPGSRAGRSTLSDFKQDNTRIMRAPRPQEVLTAFACVGAAALWGTTLEPYGALMKPPQDGGGCGSGGCGGGGCGGCGGGD